MIRFQETIDPFSVAEGHIATRRATRSAVRWCFVVAGLLLGVLVCYCSESLVAGGAAWATASGMMLVFYQGAENSAREHFPRTVTITETTFRIQSPKKDVACSINCIWWMEGSTWHDAALESAVIAHRQALLVCGPMLGAPEGPFVALGLSPQTLEEARAALEQAGCPKRGRRRRWLALVLVPSIAIVVSLLLTLWGYLFLLLGIPNGIVVVAFVACPSASMAVAWLIMNELYFRIDICGIDERARQIRGYLVHRVSAGVSVVLLTTLLRRPIGILEPVLVIGTIGLTYLAALVASSATIRAKKRIRDRVLCLSGRELPLLHESLP